MEDINVKKGLLLIAASIIFAGCSNGIYDKAMKKAQEALESGEFEKAAASYALALDEKPEDKNIKELYENTEALIHVKQAIKQDEWDKAIEKANQIRDKKSLSGYLKTELDKYAKLAEENKKANANQKVIKQNNESQNLNQEKSDSKNKTISHSNAGQRNEFLAKLDSIENGMSDLDGLYKNESTVEMKQAEHERYERWDHALNDVYNQLKMTLPSDEMEKLKHKQRQWIIYRDETALQESSKYKGGTHEQVEYLSVAARVTKERCYELVKIYMQ